MKKKKGSSLISVTVFITVIMTVAVVSLSVVANDYKMKISESKKVANLYGAESGLDIAYEVLVKVFNYAVDVANHEVETQFDSELELEQSQEKSNEIFQEAFINVFESSLQDNNLIKTENANIISYCLTNQVYPVFDEKDVTFEPFNFTSSDNLNIQVDQTRTENKITFNFISNFSSSNQNQKINDRQVSAKYNVYVPTYQGVIKEKISNVTIENFPIFSDSVINVDGNATLTGNVAIQGNLRVKGNEVSDSNLDLILYGKYLNGIQMNNGNLEITGNVITNQTLSLHQKANVTIDGDILARNVYIGKTQDVEDPTQANLLVNGSVLLDNDLVVNVQPADEASYQFNDELPIVKITNLYGLNSDNIYDLDKTKLIRESSSLIVNSIFNSEERDVIIVQKDTYLGGVAYIDTKDKPYQTGESVAIRGNYLAYSNILPGYEDGVQMEYYKPLLLVECIGGKCSLNEKADYFKEYYCNANRENNSNNLNSLKRGGVKLNRETTYITGVAIIEDYIEENIVCKSDPKNLEKYILKDTIGNFDLKILSDLKKRYASDVYNMGGGADEDDYKKGEIIKTVANQIKFDHEAFLNELDDFNRNYGDVILNNNEDITILVTTKAGDKNTINYLITDEQNKDSHKIIKTIDNVSNKALIITKGDVKLVGNGELTGNIISAGNLYIDGSEKEKENVTLVFNERATKQMIAANYKDLEGIFKVDSAVVYHPTEVEIVDGFNLGDIQTNYYPEDYIRAGRWQLLK